MKSKELKPIKEAPSDYDDIETQILKIFVQEIYLPLFKELGFKSIKNTKDDLAEAIHSGKVSFHRGVFSGKFSSKLSKELKALGATWKDGTWRIPYSDLTIELKGIISSSQDRFLVTLAKIDKRLSQILPAEIAEKVQISKLFQKELWKTDWKVRKSLEGIVVPPQMTPEIAAKIADDFTNNLQRYIQNWTEKQITSLRETVQKNQFSGARYESLVKVIKKSYGESESKARFLARQETNLLMTTFKEARYTQAGVVKYKWGCVVGSKGHEVRPMHKKLEGKIFRWDSPPITNPKGQRNNPGQDFNCRCFAKPIVEF